ncbi:hypothetical protein LTR87_011233 [Friedmanniomyces endolithicus]|nr:hypothetical protein LTR87_011233 [Friedmanniomyces endolithicus]
MASVEDSDYGSDLDEVMLEKVLGSCARPGLTTVAKTGKALAPPDDGEYGSEIDERDFDEGVSDYGSDIDSTTAERRLLSATPARFQAAPPKDMQSLGNCVGQTKSPLLSLTPELRNLIYEKTFEDFTADWIPCKFYAPPSLLLACKQIYVEAISVFYSTATFRASDFNTLDKRIRRLRTFKELNLRSLRASIKLPNGEIVWSEEPTKALALYNEKNEKKPWPPIRRRCTLPRVTLSDQDLADGMWSSTLQAFVLVIHDD